jgi:hypothetical protein
VLPGPGLVDATFGHLVPDSDDYLRGLLDDFDATATPASEGLGT